MIRKNGARFSAPGRQSQSTEIDTKTKRRGIRNTIAGAFVAALMAALLVPAPASAADITATRSVPGIFGFFQPKTVVSFTFDDGKSSQLIAKSILDKAGMDGTFYVNSGYTGAEGYLTKDDLASLAAAGHEIGGHTVLHAELPRLSLDEQKREICNDRNNLTAWGFQVRSFAYPFASFDDATKSAVAECGYNSARSLGDLETRFGCTGCGFSESFTPADKFETRALQQYENTWTLADMINSVLRAERKGGWVQYTFHGICKTGTTCGELEVPETTLKLFVTWLQLHKIFYNTSVKTVGDVIGGPVQPAVTAPLPPAATGSVNGVINPSMETLASTGQPACWMVGGWGQNDYVYTYGAPAHTGDIATSVEVSSYVDGDSKLVPQLDLGECSPTVEPGQTYRLSSWYKSTNVTQFAVYLRTTEGKWEYWTSSPWAAAAADWTEAVWTTPEIPAGYNGISFGLSNFSNGTLVTDDVAIYNAAQYVAPVVPQLRTLTAPDTTVLEGTPAPVEDNLVENLDELIHGDREGE